MATVAESIRGEGTMTINDYILEISKLVIVAYLAYGFGKYRGVFQAMEMLKNWSDDEVEEE